jgi:hypothetical protein
MRLILLIVGTISVAAVGVSQGVIPLPSLPPQIAEALAALNQQPAPANANPVKAQIPALPQILRGSNPPDGGTAGGLHGLDNTAIARAIAAEKGLTSDVFSPASHVLPPR